MRVAVVWWPESEAADLHRIRSWQDAAWIDSEVHRYANDGVGDLRRIVLPSGQRALTLVLPGYRVLMTFERTTKTLRVRRILRSVVRE